MKGQVLSSEANSLQVPIWSLGMLESIPKRLELQRTQGREPCCEHQLNKRLVLALGLGLPVPSPQLPLPRALLSAPSRCHFSLENTFSPLIQSPDSEGSHCRPPPSMTILLFGAPAPPRWGCFLELLWTAPSQKLPELSAVCVTIRPSPPVTAPPERRRVRGRLFLPDLRGKVSLVAPYVSMCFLRVTQRSRGPGGAARWGPWRLRSALPAAADGGLLQPSVQAWGAVCSWGTELSGRSSLQREWENG